MDQEQLWDAGRVIIKSPRGRPVTCTCGECRKCYGRLYYHGVRRPRAEPLEHRGAIDKNGYAVIILRPDDPLIEMAGKRKGRAVLEHRLVMARHLGRPLAEDEHVHHRNGNKLDNSIENLELWTSHHPKGQRVKDLYEWALTFARRYEREFS